MMEKTELVEMLGESVGQARAEQLVNEAAAHTGLDSRRQFSEDEALTLLDRLADADDTFVRVSATTVKTKLISQGS